MTRSAAFTQARARVSRICGTGGMDATALRLRLLGEIRRVIDFDAYAFVLTDPETAVGSAPLADVPCLRELPRLIRLKYLTTVNRWTAMERGATASLSAATGGELSGSLLWRELLARYGIGDVASSVFRDQFGVWGFLDLWRVADRPPFDDAELAFLADIEDPMTTELRRCQAETFVDRPSADSRVLGPVVLLLSAELDVIGQTPDTAAYLRTLVPPSEGRAPIPAGAYNVAAQLRAVEAGVDSNLPSARVHLSGGRWLMLRAARIGDAADAGSDIAVTIEEASATGRVSLFTRAFGLSARERELLEHLTNGTDTRELARRMFLSEHTVQDHLKSIFTKTSAHNRRTLLSRALGT